MGKIHQLTFIKHLGLWGPSPITSNKGFKFFLIMVDDKSSFTWFVPLIRKSDVVKEFIDFSRIVENIF